MIKRQLHFFSIACLAILLVPALAHAACSSPAGAEGDMRYDSTAKAVYFCDNTNWKSMASGANPLVPSDIKVTSAAASDGNFGGYAAMQTWIEANGCSGYSVCAPADINRYLLAGNTLPDITGEAFVSTGMFVDRRAGSEDTLDCNGWTSGGTGAQPITFTSNGGSYYASGDSRCDLTRAVWCCKW